MKLIKTIKTSFYLLIFLLFNSIIFTNHASATNVMTHEMAGAHHAKTETSPCVQYCQIAIAQQKQVFRQSDTEKDNDSSQPFYTQFHSQTTSSEIYKRQHYATKTKPPPIAPVHMLLNVFLD